MPNLVYNRLLVTGSPAAVDRFAERVKCVAEDEDETRVLDFAAHVPPPPEVADAPTFGIPGKPSPWLAWGRESWGTKWNAMYGVLIEPPAEGRVLYEFCTAWTPPDAWLSAASAAHPELTFLHEFGEEFDQFAGRGEWQGGTLSWMEACSCRDLDWIEDSDDEE